MTKILVPSTGPGTWRHFLAQPELHWAMGFSARTLAHCWESANGLPPEVAKLLNSVLGSVEPLLIIPEHKTPLPGGRRESQSDVFALVRHDGGLLACTIEGKVDEAFGPTVGEQMTKPTSGRRQRLDFLCERLGLQTCPPQIHYQLLHRTVSALVEAERFATRDAAMIVHSFSPTRRWFDAFSAFVCCLEGAAPCPDEPVVMQMPSGYRLLLGWATGEQRFRSS